jgi:hypothetical protein
MIVKLAVAILLAGVVAAAPALADDAPISGTVKAVDPAANTVTLESTAKGKTRAVVIYLKSGTKIVKFIRSTDPGNTGFIEQRLALTDVKPGWSVSAEAKHEGDKEVAEIVKVVLER